jgi:DNA polymerase-3 subunit gamma/tau
VSLALYRRYRPETFAEVIGQEHVTGPLQQALRSDRVNHAYLFSGPRGCGKTSSARILARALNCEKGPTPDPCGVCPSCLDLARDGGGSLDVVEIDAASHGGVDDARDLRERAFYSPASSRYKIYIIDEAHMVSSQGFNALLKVVEEPPPHLKFIFATTEPERVLGTIRSRTHHYPFRLVPPRVLQDYLQHLCDLEAVAVGPGVLPMVVRAGAGSVRDALSVLDQLIGGAGPDGVTHAYAASLLGYTDAALLDDVVDALAAGDGASVFELVDRVLESGIDPRRFVADLLERLRDLVILQAVPDAGAKGLLHAPDDQLARMVGQAGRFGPADLARAADVVNTGLTEMRGATAPRLQLELICARVLLPAADADAERGMRARLDRLERRFAISGTPEPAPRPAHQDPVVATPTPVAEAAIEPSAEADVAERTTTDASSDSASAEPAPAVAAPAEPVPAEPAPAEPAPAGAAPVAEGGLDLHAVRRMWPEILDQVKVKRRVTWMLLFDKVQVLGLDERSLTLGFPDAGSVKGFTAGGHDEVLRQSIIDIVGADWRIEPVHQPGGPGGTPVLASPPVEPPMAPHDQAPPTEESKAPVVPPAAGAGAEATSPSPAAASGADEPAADDEDAADSGLAGAELVARELGGRVIGEFGADQT